jgi:hypothetical protein
VGHPRILRVTVRGRFGDLPDQALGFLRSNLDQHDVSNSEYTPEGVLTYDGRIDHFSIRYEIRLEPGQPDITAADQAISEAGQFLRVMGFDHRALRAAVSDVAELAGRRRRCAEPARVDRP